LAKSISDETLKAKGLALRNLVARAKSAETGGGLTTEP
jgi:hypothetical protein